MNRVKTYALWLLVIQTLQMAMLTFWLFRSKSAIYGTNDDSLLASIASGQLTGQIEPRLIFIQPIISYPITWLEVVFTTLSGYSFFLIFCTMLSYSSVLAVLIVDKKIKTITIVTWTSLNIIFQSWFALNPTYTGASLFAAGASAFHLNYIFNNQNKLDLGIVRLNYFLGALFLILCYGIRKEGVYVLFLLVIPTLILKIKNITFKKSLTLYFAVPIIIAFLLNQFLYLLLYSGEKWDKYMELNESRHKIQLRAPEKYIINNLDSIGWDKETYYMFMRFSLIDDDQMNVEKMNSILISTQEYVGPKSIIKSDIIENSKIVIESFNPWTWILKLILLLIAILVLSKIYEQKFKEFFIFLILQSVLIIIFLLVLGFGYQIPERISLNFLAAFSLSLFAQFTSRRLQSERFSLLMRSTNILMIIIFIQLTYSRLPVETNAREGLYLTRQAYAKQQVGALSNLADQVVISNGSGLKTHWQFPYSKWNTFDPRDKTIILGWQNLSPLSTQQFSKRDLDLNMFPTDIYKSNIYWVDSPEDIEKSLKYFEKFSNSTMKYYDVGSIGNDEYHFYRFLISE